MFIHLTNVAIQKHGETYNAKHGNKWPLQNLEMYIAGTQGTDACRRLFSEIDSVMINSLKACQNVMINDRHCFELYGRPCSRNGGGFHRGGGQREGINAD